MRGEAFFRLAFLDTFWAKQKVSKQEKEEMFIAGEDACNGGSKKIEKQLTIGVNIKIAGEYACNDATKNSTDSGGTSGTLAPARGN